MSDPEKRTGGKAGAGRGQGGGGRGKGGGGRGKGGGGGGQGAGGRGKAGGRRPDADDTVAQLAGPLQGVLKRLPATQREVIEWRMGLKDGHPTDLADTARAMGISLSEAREIEKRAFEHIREVVPLDRLQKLLKG
ncbi:MAG: hypothetical protein KY461_08195 [Actinobacteria bacterium]|nr:hypothetical protein [Actinomycetota bacterium]